MAMVIIVVFHSQVASQNTYLLTLVPGTWYLYRSTVVFLGTGTRYSTAF